MVCHSDAMCNSALYKLTLQILIMNQSMCFYTIPNLKSFIFKLKGNDQLEGDNMGLPSKFDFKSMGINSHCIIKLGSILCHKIYHCKNSQLNIKSKSFGYKMSHFVKTRVTCQLLYETMYYSQLLRKRQTNLQ